MLAPASPVKQRRGRIVENRWNMNEETDQTCPYCNGELERGFLLGDVPRFSLIRLGLQWFPGEPAWSRTMMELGEQVGTVEFGKGVYAKGTRCRNCRKITLDY